MPVHRRRRGSNIDCYHPSSQGRGCTISRETWNDGPFRDAQKGS
ncbi:MAG: hypothetical protein U1F09_16320 [Steroidobacteraceae bacterium]